MSDTLVERLRDEVYEWSGGLAVRDCDEDSQDLADLLREAADRIEELERERTDLSDDERTGASSYEGAVKSKRKFPPCPACGRPQIEVTETDYDGIKTKHLRHAEARR